MKAAQGLSGLFLSLDYERFLPIMLKNLPNRCMIWEKDKHVGRKDRSVDETV